MYFLQIQLNSRFHQFLLHISIHHLQYFILLKLYNNLKLIQELNFLINQPEYYMIFI